jgi:hypothetical protein
MNCPDLKRKMFRHFEIQDDFLYQLMTYGDGVLKEARLPIRNWNQGENFTKGLIIYLTSRALNLHRYPWHHDRTLSSRDHSYDEAALQVLFSGDRLSVVLEEIRKLYRHVQFDLKVHEVQTLRLGRGLIDRTTDSNDVGYATFVARLEAAARRLGRPSFHIEMDTLNSWSTGSHYGLSEVALIREVPAVDLAWSSDFIASRYQGFPRAALESGEYVVINRAASGVVDIPVGSLELSDRVANQVQKWMKTKSDKYLDAYLREGREKRYPVASAISDLLVLPSARVSLVDRLRLAWRILRDA